MLIGSQDHKHKNCPLTCSNHPLNADVGHIDLLGKISDGLVGVLVCVWVDVGPATWQADWKKTSTSAKAKALNICCESFLCFFFPFFFFTLRSVSAIH